MSNLNECFKCNLKPNFNNNILKSIKDNQENIEHFYQGQSTNPLFYKLKRDNIKLDYDDDDEEKNNGLIQDENEQKNYTKFFDDGIILKNFNQIRYANYLFPNTSKCRDDGYLCKSNSEISTRNKRDICTTDFYKPTYLNIFDTYDSYK